MCPLWLEILKPFLISISVSTVIWRHSETFCLLSLVNSRYSNGFRLTKTNFVVDVCTSQSKPPSFGSRGRVVDVTLTPVKRHQYPYPLRLEFRSNVPTPEVTKMKISKFQEKKDLFERRTFPTLHVQVCSFD